jgi:hypothetical protein
MVVSDQLNMLPDFDGATYERWRDHVRLGRQAFAVWAVLSDGNWHTLRELSQRTGHPEASVSARIRDLRKRKFGGNEVERENLGKGTWRYRLVLPERPSADVVGNLDR